MKRITVSVRSVYGTDTVYPACPDAVRFAALARTRTLTAETLRLIEALGYEIAIETPRILRAG